MAGRGGGLAGVRLGAKGQGWVSPHRLPAEEDTRLRPTLRPRIQSDKEHQYTGWRFWLGGVRGAGGQGQ